MASPVLREPHLGAPVALGRHGRATFPSCRSSGAVLRRTLASASPPYEVLARSGEGSVGHSSRPIRLLRFAVHDHQRDHRALKTPQHRDRFRSIGSEIAVIDQIQDLLDHVGGLSSSVRVSTTSIILPDEWAARHHRSAECRGSIRLEREPRCLVADPSERDDRQGMCPIRCPNRLVDLVCSTRKMSNLSRHSYFRWT